MRERATRRSKTRAAVAAVALALLTLPACGKNAPPTNPASRTPAPEENTMKLPRPTLPAGTWLSYENLALDDTDRSANWRYVVTRDGCWFQTRNTAMFVTADQLDSDDPADHWNTPLPEKPQRCFDAGQQARLKAAIDAVGFGRIAAHHDAGERPSHPTIERWIHVDPAGAQRAITSIEGAGPDSLGALKAAVNALVTEAAEGAR